MKSDNLSSPGAGGLKQKKSVLSSALWVALGTLSSRILGLFRDVILAAYFPRYITDAWLVAFRIPNLFRRLFGEGSLSVAFIPVLVQELDSGKKEGPQRLINSVFTLLLIVLIAILTLGLIFTEQVVGVLTPGAGFQSVPGKVDLTIQLARIMMAFVVLVCLYAYFMALQNSIKKFAMPAFAPVLLNVAIIAAAFVPSDLFTNQGVPLAWAVVIGGLLQVVFVIPGVLKSGLFPKFSFDFSSPAVKKVFRNIIPSLIGLGILQLTVLVNTRFASYLPEGANSWIFWADRLLEFPLSLVAVSMGTALLPTLSEHHARKEFDQMSAVLNQSLRYVLMLAIPAGVGMFVLSPLLIETIFMRGEFGSVDAENTALVLKIYGAAIFTYSTIRIMQPAFYAAQNTWLPALVSASCLGLHILLASRWVHSVGIEGLAFSSVISATVNMTALFVMYRFLIGKFNFPLLLKNVLKMVIASVFMGYGIHLINEHWVVDTFGMRLLKTGSCVAIGGSLYFSIAYLLKAEELSFVLGKLKAKLKL